MVEKSDGDNVRKQDLELILEVNKKAVELQTEVVEQHEEIMDSLDKIKTNQNTQDNRFNKQSEQLDSQDDKLDKLVEMGGTIDKTLFRIQVLFVTGALALIAQIIEIFLKK
jgi:hypothetical protein